MRTMATDSEIARGCDDLDFGCNHKDCKERPTALWKDPGSTAAAIALCDRHILDSADGAERVLDL